MISVLLTTYNDSEFLPFSIKSVLNQTYSNFEFVIVDDGSLDYTEQIVNSFLDKRINYYKINHAGRSKALNYGLSVCKNEWVALIDSDDLWHPEKLQKQKELINDENDIIFTNAYFFYKKFILFDGMCPNDQIKLQKKILLHGCLVNSSLIYNKRKIIKIGLYNTELTNSEDYDLLIRLAANSNYKYIDDYLVFCRLRNNSLSTINNVDTKKNIRLIQKKYFESSKNYIFKNINSENHILNAWREYFYGTKETARKIWWQNKNLFLKDYRISIAFIFTFLPKPIFEIILSQRFRLRIRFITKKILGDKTVLHAIKVFNKII